MRRNLIVLGLRLPVNKGLLHCLILMISLLAASCAGPDGSRGLDGHRSEADTLSS